jgi:hypothetical protein
LAITTTLQEAIALSDAGIRIKLGAGEALSAVCGGEGNEVQAFPLNAKYRAFPRRAGGCHTKDSQRTPKSVSNITAVAKSNKHGIFSGAV